MRRSARTTRMKNIPYNLDDSSPERSRPMRKRKRTLPSNQDNKSLRKGKENMPHNSDIEESESENDEKMSDYERLRLKNIQERERMMRDLGLHEALVELEEVTPKKPQPVKRVKTPAEPLPRREPSRRLRNLAAKSTKDVKQEILDKSNEEEEEKDERLLTSMSMENEESLQFLETLKKVKTEVKIDPGIQLSTCSSEEFQSALCSFKMVNESRMAYKRIQSLHVHPSSDKLLVMSGCVNGELGIWDVESDTTASFRPHKAPLNCISVSTSDATKVFTTSHDGTLICADLEQTIFSNLYATSFYDKVSHLTWHDQVDPNTLLLAHGNGSVGVVDIRDSKNIKTWYPCFERSARSVQRHPVRSEYFIAASGAGNTCNMYDMRKCSNYIAEPVCEMSHRKGLTSGFFSSSGNLVLTTCNDDYVRIFPSPFESYKPKAMKEIPHNNHTGRWLSVFKATWYPGRDDAFHIGSLLNPRRIQIYGLSGKLVSELKDENLNSVTSCVSAHPLQPFIAGANSSGRVFAFSLLS